MSDSPSFLNQVVRISTELDPAALLTEIRELEEYYGRRRSADKYLDREMDVDVLSYDQLVSDDPGCLVPHPRMHLRRFVLMPLAALSPDWKHPVLQKTADQLLSACEDSSKVSVYAGT
jgi:2-amino-4-hydroxy-6-hydroxymethyldihydropteridine diphosphokinase